jgi:hypothetical protein
MELHFMGRARRVVLIDVVKYGDVEWMRLKLADKAECLHFRPGENVEVTALDHEF